MERNGTEAEREADEEVWHGLMRADIVLQIQMHCELHSKVKQLVQRAGGTCVLPMRFCVHVQNWLNASAGAIADPRDWGDDDQDPRKQGLGTGMPPSATLPAAFQISTPGDERERRRADEHAMRAAMERAATVEHERDMLLQKVRERDLAEQARTEGDRIPLLKDSQAPPDVDHWCMLLPTAKDEAAAEAAQVAADQTAARIVKQAAELAQLVEQAGVVQAAAAQAKQAAAVEIEQLRTQLAEQAAPAGARQVAVRAAPVAGFGGGMTGVGGFRGDGIMLQATDSDGSTRSVATTAATLTDPRVVQSINRIMDVWGAVVNRRGRGLD